jgi:hypothetical protein
VDDRPSFTEPPAFNDDFRDMLAALIDQGVELIIVGAHAMALHGVPRATGDIDILVRPSVDNAARGMRALATFGAPVAAHGVTQADFEVAGNVYQIGLPPRRIDLLTEISGVSFDEAWRTRIVVERDGLALTFLDRERLLANKRATGRDKDQLDVSLLTKLDSDQPDE